MPGECENEGGAGLSEQRFLYLPLLLFSFGSSVGDMALLTLWIRRKEVPFGSFLFREKEAFLGITYIH